MLELIGVVFIFAAGWFVAYLLATAFSMTAMLALGGVLKLIAVVVNSIYFCVTGKHTDLLPPRKRKRRR